MRRVPGPIGARAGERECPDGTAADTRRRARVAMSSGDRIRNVTKRLRLRAAPRLGVTRAVLPGVHHAVERRMVLVSRLSRAFHDHRLRRGERALSRLCGQTAIGRGIALPDNSSAGGGLAARGDRLSHAACPAARPLRRHPPRRAVSMRAGPTAVPSSWSSGELSVTANAQNRCISLWTAKAFHPTRRF